MLVLGTSHNLLPVLINRLQLSSHPPSPRLCCRPSRVARPSRLLRAVSRQPLDVASRCVVAASLLQRLSRGASTRCRVAAASDNVHCHDDETCVFVQRSDGAAAHSRYCYRYLRYWARAETR